MSVTTPQAQSVRDMLRSAGAATLCCLGIFGLAGAGGSGELSIVAPLVLALMPAALFIAFRAPLIFPFGLWAALIPFDFLLSSGSLTRYLALLATVMLALRIIGTRRMVAAPNSWFPWLIVVVWMMFTSLWTIGPDQSGAALGAVIPLFIMMTVVAVYPITVLEMRGVLIAIVIGALASAAYGFSLYAHGQLAGGDGRLTLTNDSGLTVDPNFFATSFLLPITICLSVVLAHRSPWVRLLAGGAMAAMIVSIFLSGSRGAFISVSCVFVYFVFKMRNRFILVGVALATAFTFTLFPTVARRFSEDQTNSNGSGRTFIWDVGSKALADHNHWLMGAGVGTFPVAYNTALRSVFQPVFQGWSRPAHNVLVGTSVELGFLGTALLLYAWWKSFRQASVITKASPNYPVRLMVEASMLGLFVNALFIDPMLIKFYWLAFMLPIMVHNVDRPILLRRSRPMSRQFAQLRIRRALLSAPRR